MCILITAGQGNPLRKLTCPKAMRMPKNKLGTIADENRMLFISRSPCFCSVLNSKIRGNFSGSSAHLLHFY